MQGFANQSRPDLSRFEAMSTDELKEILRNDAFAKEDDPDADINTILYISEIVARREGTPDAKAAWAEFERSYLPDVDKGPNLYELIAEEESADAPARWSVSRLRILRLALAAAAVVVLAVSAAFAVSKVGWFRSWNVDYLWSKQARGEEYIQAEVMPKPDYYDELAEALESIGAPDHMIPLWLPEGYEMVECMNENGYSMASLTAVFRNAQGKEIVLRCVDYSTGDTAMYSKDEGSPDTYTVGNVDHSITTNMDCYRAIWWRWQFECFIFGFESRDDLIKTIDSMYREVIL